MKVHIPSDKIKAISQVPIRKNKSEFKAFLRFVNYYGKFIKNMFTIASPLYALLKNNTEYVWGKDQD